MRLELAGFRTLEREQIQIATGFSAQINAQLEVPAIQETVMVTSESSIAAGSPRACGG